jgi:hypothetical protein
MKIDVTKLSDADWAKLQQQEHRRRQKAREQKLRESFDQSLLEIDEPHRDHQFAMRLFDVAKAFRANGQLELADKIKALGNRFMPLPYYRRR